MFVGSRYPNRVELLERLAQAGVPVRAQLLGSDPACMADNAARLAGMGPAGIDINFGCPVRKVVGTLAGSALMREVPGLSTTIQLLPLGMEARAVTADGAAPQEER